MDFQFSDKEEALRTEIREFVKQELPPGWIRNALAEESTDEDWAFTLSIAKKLSEKGGSPWLGPKSMGGWELPFGNSWFSEKKQATGGYQA